MKHVMSAVAACIVALLPPAAAGRADNEAVPIFDIKIPSGYRDWKLVSVAHEAGKLNDLRAILGNDIAIEALMQRHRSITRRQGRASHHGAMLLAQSSPSSTAHNTARNVPQIAIAIVTHISRT